MRRSLPIARQFRSPQKNQQRNLIFNSFVILLLLIVLVGVLSPPILRVVSWTQTAYSNFKSNIALRKVAAVNPIAPNIKDIIEARADKSIFEPKNYQDIDPYTLQVTDRTGLIVFFGKDGDINGQLSSLQSLLTKSRIESKRLVRVDLRFNKIAVEYDTSK
jgi:hypothetical protein